MTKKVCISGYYGFDNFGDEIILKILVENLKKFDCNPEITVFSSSLEKTASNLNVKSVYTFNYAAIIKNLRESDCLISGGGSLLQDATSTKSLIYYLGVIFLAAVFGKKIIIFAQGIGPVNNKPLAKLTAYLLKKASLVTVRDDDSLKLLNKWKVKAIKCCDPVRNINLSKSKSSNTGKIGIQLRDFPTMKEEFIFRLADCINYYYKDKEINIMSLQNNVDLNICKKLQNRLLTLNPELNIKIIENTSNEKIIEDICTMDEFTAMRYHACLIAIKARIKLLPLSYDIKVESLAKEFELDYINITAPEETAKIFKRFIEKEINFNKDKIDNMMFDFKLLEQAL